MRPIRGSLRIEATIVEGGVRMLAQWRDEDGAVMTQYPPLLVPSGGSLTIEPIWGMLGVSDTSEFRIDWLTDYVLVGAEVQAVGGAK